MGIYYGKIDLYGNCVFGGAETLPGTYRAGGLANRGRGSRMGRAAGVANGIQGACKSERLSGQVPNG